MRTSTRFYAAAILALGMAGCGVPEGGEPLPSRAGPASVQNISTRNLPKLGMPMTPLDEGRVEISPPESWHVPPRRAKWLVRFQAEPGSPYPVIFLTVADAESLPDVMLDNLDAFAAQVRKQFQADPHRQRLAAGVRPIVVGDFQGVLYQRWGKVDGRIMERRMLETVVNGRRYTFELRSREGLAEEAMPYLYAVAAGTRFRAGSQNGVPPADPDLPAGHDQDGFEAP